jgi:hypothetical protein
MTIEATSPMMVAAPSAVYRIEIVIFSLVENPSPD